MKKITIYFQSHDVIKNNNKKPNCSPSLQSDMIWTYENISCP